LGESNILNKFEFKPFKEPGWSDVKEAFSEIGKRHMGNVEFIMQGVSGNFVAVASEHEDRLKGIKKVWTESSAVLRKTSQGL
jgi:hypothetical protein